MRLLQYKKGQKKPAVTGVFIADILGGLYSTSAIQTALFQRERSGIGQQIDTTLMEWMEDPQAFHYGSFVDVEDTAGKFRVVNPPYKMSGTAYHVCEFVPRLGQHTDEVLGIIAGFDARKISALNDKGALVFG